MGSLAAPIVSFAAVLLVILPLPYHLGTKNTAILCLALWIFQWNLFQGINFVVWNGSVVRKWLVYCDISESCCFTFKTVFLPFIIINVNFVASTRLLILSIFVPYYSALLEECRRVWHDRIQYVHLAPSRAHILSGVHTRRPGGYQTTDAFRGPNVYCVSIRLCRLPYVYSTT
jgi:hypothetical protein